MSSHGWRHHLCLLSLIALFLSSWSEEVRHSRHDTLSAHSARHLHWKSTRLHGRRLPVLSIRPPTASNVQGNSLSVDVHPKEKQSNSVHGKDTVVNLRRDNKLAVLPEENTKNAHIYDNEQGHLDEFFRNRKSLEEVEGLYDHLERTRRDGGIYNIGRSSRIAKRRERRRIRRERMRQRRKERRKNRKRRPSIENDSVTSLSTLDISQIEYDQNQGERQREQAEREENRKERRRERIARRRKKRKERRRRRRQGRARSIVLPSFIQENATSLENHSACQYRDLLICANKTLADMSGLRSVDTIQRCKQRKYFLGCMEQRRRISTNCGPNSTAVGDLSALRKYIREAIVTNSSCIITESITG